MNKPSKKNVTAWLARRFFLRIHMFVILGGTYVAGAIATRMLYAVGVDILWLRYALAVCGAYLVFLILIRLWLAYVGAMSGPDVDVLDGVDFCADLVSELNPIADLSTVPAFGSGGGGVSGGGGASGGWDLAELDVTDLKVPSSGSNLPGCGLDLDLDEGFFVVVLLIVLVFALALAGFYLIYVAPAILGEAAFEAALAFALARRAKKIDRPGWVGSVTRATMWPFLAVLALSIVLGAYAQKHCPDARRLVEAIDCASPR